MEYKLAISRTQVQLGSSNSVRSTITSLTARRKSSTVDQDNQDVPLTVDQENREVPSTVDQDNQDVPSSVDQDNQDVPSRPKLKVHTDPFKSSYISSLTSNASPVHQFTLSSRTSRVYSGSFSPITGPHFPKFITSLGVSNSSTIHPNYRYASSLWKDHLRYANSSRFLESPRAAACICLSELVPAGLPSPKFTPDRRASLVIRVIECIAAHLPIDSKAEQFVREQTLDFDSAG